MTKNMYLALFCLALLFCGCGFFITVIQKDETQKNVDMFLLHHRLQNNVTYDGVSFSLSAPVTLKNIVVKNTKKLSFPNSISRLTLNAYEEKDGIPTALTVTAKNIRFNLSDLAQAAATSPDDFAVKLSNFNPVADIVYEPVTAALLAGCDALNANATFDYAYSAGARKMYVKLDVADACLGHAVLTVGLSGVSSDVRRHISQALFGFLTGKDGSFPIDELTKNAAMTKFDLTYTEGRLISGYKRYVDTLYLRLPGQTATELDSRHIQSIASYLSFFSVHTQRNLEIARTLAKFVKNPKTVSFTGKTGKEVALKTLKGDTLRRVVDLLMRADVNVTLQ